MKHGKKYRESAKLIDRQKLEFRLDVLEAVTRRNIPEIEKLKKAR